MKKNILLGVLLLLLSIMVFADDPDTTGTNSC